MQRSALAPILAATLALTLGACGKNEDAGAGDQASEKPPAPSATPPDSSTLAAAEWSDARADFVSPSGEKMGAVEFHDGVGGVLIRVDIDGLTPGWHGIHLHMIGSCADGADGFKASGGHINPDGLDHGLLNPNGAHRADIPNLHADDTGRARGEFFRTGVFLRPSEIGAAINGPYPLIDDDGFAVIIHESPDDHVTQPIGGAGARVACAAVVN
ncbi:MAG: superoxide dismutase family protein [Parvularculaceae bacterium]|nr:superoxide dismutase family protein [Parvularculaceae bacterium]